MESYKEILPNITTFIFDVDGVFTNSNIVLMPSGEMVRTMSVRDGYAVQLAIKKGFNICIITGGKDTSVQERFYGLGVTDVHLGVKNKKAVLKQYLETNNIDPATSIYVGDDIPDWEVMQMVGLPCCPVDAVAEIKKLSRYISPIKGGEGCVRDVIEQTLKVQGKWMDHLSTQVTSA